MFWITLLAVFAFSNAWICGNDGQCMCSNSGEVLCSGVAAAPTFAEEYKHGRRLTLELSDREFDMDTLNRAAGFDSVLVIGLPPNLCGLMEREYPFAVCLLPKTVEFIGSTVDPPAAEESTGSNNKGLIAWVTITSIAGLVIITCILVSLVNLHARINTHARAEDPPLFAVDCCLRCMAILLCPLHMCARLCNCRDNCLYSLERGQAPATRAFSV